MHNLHSPNLLFKRVQTQFAVTISFKKNNILALRAKFPSPKSPGLVFACFSDIAKDYRDKSESQVRQRQALLLLRCNICLELLQETINDPYMAQICPCLQELSYYQFEDTLDAADIPLPPSLSLIPLTDHVADEELAINLQRDDSDDDNLHITISYQDATSKERDVTLDLQQHDATNHQPSTFDVSREYRPIKLSCKQLIDLTGWSGANWQTLTTAPLDLPRVLRSGAQERSSAVSNSNSIQVRLGHSPFGSTREQISNIQNIRTDRFVSALEKFDELVSDYNASARFADIPNRCLANTKVGKRCSGRKKISIEDQSRIRNLLADLTELNFETDPSACITALLEFTKLAVCSHQRKDIQARIRRLQPQWGPFQSDNENLLRYLPQLLVYRTSASARLTVSQIVMNQAQSTFKVNANPQKELGEGYIYVYWNEAAFGVQKIGTTIKNVTDRLKQWEKTCNHVAREQYRSPRKIRHAKKVERLVHADLSGYRVYEPTCRTCRKSHKEWFKDVDLPLIIERIETWSKWISEEPYEKAGSEWRLTDKGRDSLPLAINPHDPLPPRYNLRPRR